MSEEVKGEGPNDVLPMDKATRDTADAGRQYEFGVTQQEILAVLVRLNGSPIAVETS
jgi:hypothetical protein